MSKRKLLFQKTKYISFLCLINILGANCVSYADTSKFCSEVRQLVTEAKVNFLRIDTATNEAVKLLHLADANRCFTSLSLTGATAYHCVWSFPYRDSTASVAFKKYNHALKGCFGDDTEITQDQSVNHPDYYEQRQFLLDRASVSVSLKDKSALQQTLVFVAVNGTIVD